VVDAGVAIQGDVTLANPDPEPKRLAAGTYTG
jgi:hypothetical protein